MPRSASRLQLATHSLRNTQLCIREHMCFELERDASEHSDLASLAAFEHSAGAHCPLRRTRRIATLRSSSETRCSQLQLQPQLVPRPALVSTLCSAPLPGSARQRRATHCRHAASRCCSAIASASSSLRRSVSVSPSLKWVGARETSRVSTFKSTLESPTSPLPSSLKYIIVLSRNLLRPPHRSQARNVSKHTA